VLHGIDRVLLAAFGRMQQPPPPAAWRERKERIKSDDVGVVKVFDPPQSSGFITPDGGGADVFVHVSAVERAGMSDPPSVSASASTPKPISRDKSSREFSAV